MPRFLISQLSWLLWVIDFIYFSYYWNSKTIYVTLCMTISDTSADNMLCTIVIVYYAISYYYNSWYILFLYYLNHCHNILCGIYILFIKYKIFKKDDCKEINEAQPTLFTLGKKFELKQIKMKPDGKQFKYIDFFIGEENTYVGLVKNVFLGERAFCKKR